MEPGKPGETTGETRLTPRQTQKKWSEFAVAILLVTFLGWLSDPFKWVSDLQLGDEKVTLNHLVVDFFLVTRNLV